MNPAEVSQQAVVDFLSRPATHGGAEIEKTVHALRETVRALKAEREVKAA